MSHEQRVREDDIHDHMITIVDKLCIYYHGVCLGSHTSNNTTLEQVSKRQTLATRYLAASSIPMFSLAEVSNDA